MRPKRTFWENIVNFAQQKPLGAFGAAVVILLVVLAIFAPIVATDDPRETNAAYRFNPPNADTWLGGDQIGRDVYSRLVYGTRISLVVGLLSVFFGVTIGAFIGIVSGYFGGITDLVIQRIMDAMMSFPALILALADHGDPGGVGDQRGHRAQRGIHTGRGTDHPVAGAEHQRG